MEDKIYELTEHGKDFIRKVANYYDDKNKSLLEGSNGVLPLSDETEDRTWVSHVKNTLNNDIPITTNSEFAEYLINLFETYAKKSNVDANIMAAQAFEESEYRCWYYPIKFSPSSISQLPMNMIYDAIYKKFWLTDDEKNKITDGMERPDIGSSWIKVLNTEPTDNTTKRQRANHSILHQNMIDNPDIVINLQCRFMNYISLKNNNHASSSLFTYTTRNWEGESNNYIQAINRYAKEETDDKTLPFTKYVEKVFGYLGDPNQKYVTLLLSYVKGFSFNYSIDYGYDEYKIDTVSNYTPERSTKDRSALITELRDAYDYAESKFNTKYDGVYSVRLSSVFRTKAYQNELFRVGRGARGTVPGNTLTPVSGIPPDLSRHNKYKTDAFDFNIFDSANRFVDGKRIAENRPLYREFYGFVTEIAPTAVWGGGFSNQKNDVVHIQLTAKGQ